MDGKRGKVEGEASSDWSAVHSGEWPPAAESTEACEELARPAGQNKPEQHVCHLVPGAGPWLSKTREKSLRRITPVVILPSESERITQEPISGLVVGAKALTSRKASLL